MDLQDWLQLYVPSATPPQPQAPSSEDIGQQQQDSRRHLNLTPFQIPLNHGVLYADDISDHFAEGDDDDPFIIITEEDTQQRRSTGIAEALIRSNNIMPSSHSLLQLGSSTFSTVLNTVENVIYPSCSKYEGAPETESCDYGLYGISANNFMSSSNINAPIFEDHVNAPTYGTYPYDCGSRSTPDSTCASRITALETLDSSSKSTGAYPTYDNCHASPYDDVGDTSPSNTSFPDACTPSASYTSFLIEVLDYLLLLFDEGEETVEGTNQESAPDPPAGQDVSATRGPAENGNKDNVNLAQTENEQAAWAVNSLHEEGVAALTHKFDYDTGAGPSTGSSVASAMLDIGHAPHSRRNDGPAVILSAQDKPRGKGKRKAMDAPESQPSSKKPRVEPLVQMMDNVIYTLPTPDFSVHLYDFNQRAATKFIQVSPGTASEGLGLLTGQESAYMTFAQEKNGALKARSMVSARDSHACRCLQN